MNVPEKLKRFHTQITIRRKIVQNLHQVIDPELGVNMVDLGLVYNIIFDDQQVIVEYTATTPGCPMRRYFQHKIEEALLLIEEIDQFQGKLVMEPQWGIEMMNAELRSHFASPPSYQAPGFGSGYGGRR
jgi:metal-sulfur cluster biosynthetic enzyme